MPTGKLQRIFVHAALTAASLALAPVLAQAAGGVTPKTTELSDGHVVRVGGTYTVTAIDKNDDGSFAVVFRTVAPSGKYDELRLQSDHVHVAVKVGQTLRLSAEILSERGATAEISQVMLFLPHQQGPVPVWLLSNKAAPKELKGSRYLEMHSPVNDYIIM
jgi:hypothetical protein